MEQAFQVFLISLLIPVGALAQAVPAATWSPQDSVPPGFLSYSVRYSQTAQFSQQEGNWQSAFVSGDVTYANGSQRLPFSVNYGGGYGWTIGGPSYDSGLFQHMVISQGIGGHRWRASVSDDVSYTPQAPTFGFSGVPGTGEPIAGGPPTASLPTQTILTLSTDVLENTVAGQFSRNVNAALSINAGASYDILNFPKGNGLDTNTTSANGGLTWRLGALNSLTSEYQFSQFTYTGINLSFQMQSAMFGVNRAWTRNLSTSFSVGPEWISSSTPSLLPPSTLLAASASLGYQMGHGAFGLNYSRGVNGGAGYMLGGQVDTVSVSYTRDFGRSLNAGLFGSYSRISTLANQAGFPLEAQLINGTVTSELGGGQVSRTFGRHISVFGNYSIASQGSGTSVPGNTLNETIQILGFGIGFTPAQLRLHSSR